MKHRIGALATAAALLCTGCIRDIPGGTERWDIPVEPEYIVTDSGPRVTLILEVPLGASEPLTQELAALARRYGADSGPAPGVRILVRGGTGGEQDLLAQLLGKAPAELYLMPADYIFGFRQDGLLRELSGEFEDAPSFLPAARAYCGDAGELYAAPYLGTTTALLYSEALLEKSGFSTPPATWSALRDACRWISVSTEAAGFAGVAYGSEDLADIFTQLLAAFGGSYAGEGSADARSAPELARALIFYRELLQNGSTEEYALNDMDRAVQEFWLGRAAMTIGTPAHLAMLEKNGFRASAAELPGEKQGGSARLWAYAFAVPADTESEHASAACAFVRWLLEPGQLDAVLRAQYEGFDPGSQSPRRESLLLPLTQEGAPKFFRNYPQYAAFTVEMAQAAAPTPGKKWAQFRQNALLPILRRILMDEEAVEDGVAALRQKGSEILMN